MKKIITSQNKASSCFFRTSIKQPNRKALIQITERCNLHCTHCFVSAGDYGSFMSLENIEKIVIPRLKSCRVVNITLTGGEPFVHKDIINILQLLKEADLNVGICTNATCIKQHHLEALEKLGGIHLNVSLDGFSEKSHGVFRGNKKSFIKTIKMIKVLAKKQLLQGLLVTPNNLAESEEYTRLCDFAVENKASYVLMNPLSPMGRGVKSIQ